MNGYLYADYKILHMTTERTRLSTSRCIPKMKLAKIGYDFTINLGAYDI